MSDKNIVVPDFVVAAIIADPLVVAACDGREVSLTEPVAREIARRVCVALSENPTAPNDKQTYEIREAFFNQNTVKELIEFTVLEWQRRMFLAPEVPEIRTFVKRLADSYCGVTLTPQEADFIVEQLRYVTHGWDGGAK